MGKATVVHRAHLLWTLGCDPCTRWCDHHDVLDPPTIMDSHWMECDPTTGKPLEGQSEDSCMKTEMDDFLAIAMQSSNAPANQDCGHTIEDLLGIGRDPEHST